MRCIIENGDKKIVFETKKITYVVKQGDRYFQIGFDSGDRKGFGYETAAERDAEYERVLGCWNAGDRKARIEGHLTGD